jgi:hypothetical protein
MQCRLTATICSTRRFEENALRIRAKARRLRLALTVLIVGLSGAACVIVLDQVIR